MPACHERCLKVRLRFRGPLEAWTLMAMTCVLYAVSASASEKYGLGDPASPAQIASWNIEVFPTGENLPQGRATIGAGKAVYEIQCASCHGVLGEGGVGDRLVGGIGSLADKKPLKTVGSYWPYATTLFDYIRRAMPLNAPQSLSNEDVYAVTGYVLSLNGLWPENTQVDSTSLLKVTMPNRNGFVDDPRPDVP